MSIRFETESDGKLRNVRLHEIRIPYCEKQGLEILYGSKTVQVHWKTIGEYQYAAETSDARFNMAYTASEENFRITIRMTWLSDREPDAIRYRTGIDTYMTEAPQWNEKYFPTMLRCEKTHLWGYCTSPAGKSFAVFSPSPVSSFSYEYNDGDGFYYGHRIYTVDLDLYANGPLPDRHPQNKPEVGKEQTWHLIYCPLREPEEIYEKAYIACRMPLCRLERTILKPGERIRFTANQTPLLRTEICDPDGQPFDPSGPVMKAGVYKIRLTGRNGMISEACVSVLRPLMWYLNKAREAALAKPQKATTHAESWYGFYSAFLAAKHDPKPDLDKKLDASFREILPLMFDPEKGEPILIPERIQNTASMIGVLVDRYEANRKQNTESLYLASRLGDWLMTKQHEDGAYYRNGTQHYTCVIYIAKSMLELAEAERELLPDRSHVHEHSAQRAVENLIELLENIGTEGEGTLEDGMISCSALQIASYALTLPEDKRQRYIDAAEHMIRIHECLEQNIIPDSRIRGGTLRFWEAQYDVLIHRNMFTSPHGWTAWSVYALYDLYLLTGKVCYLIRAYNALGACLQLMSFDGELRWGFVTDPQVFAERFEPDPADPKEEGYENTDGTGRSFGGRFTQSVIGEEYIPMISGWYRIGKEKRVGGYLKCPLFFADHIETPDNQGGCCDNDVHEIFKCLEETFLKKAFVYELDDGSVHGIECEVNSDKQEIRITTSDPIEFLHLNIRKPRGIILNGHRIEESSMFGMTRIK